LGSLQQSSTGGAYSAPLTFWLHLSGATFEGRGGKINEGEKEARKKEFGPPNLHHRSTSLAAACTDDVLHYQVLCYDS